VTTILVVDSDLGFVAYLCMMLTEAGYSAVPATSAEAAIALLPECGLPHVDLLIVDFALPGAIAFTEALKKRATKAIGIEHPGVAQIKPTSVDAILRRPYSFDPAAALEWLRTVRRVLSEAA